MQTVEKRVGRILLALAVATLMMAMMAVTAASAFALPSQAENGCKGIAKSQAPQTPAREHSPLWPVCKG